MLSSLALTALMATHPIGKPNVILFMADDLGYFEVGSNGQQKIRTPNID